MTDILYLLSDVFEKKDTPHGLMYNIVMPLILFITIMIVVIGMFIWAINANQPISVPVIPQEGEITITGEVVCLPHKDTSGPQTLECAFGLENNEGTYFALQDSSIDYSNIAGLEVGSRVTIEGTFQNSPSDRYQDIGLIVVDSVVNL
jgi:hypothetical protein